MDFLFISYYFGYYLNLIFFFVIYQVPVSIYASQLLRRAGRQGNPNLKSIRYSDFSNNTSVN
jgi:hypothetical protein